MNDHEGRYYFHADTFYYHHNNAENRYQNYLFEIKRSNFLVKDIFDKQTIHESKFKILNDNTISIGSETEETIPFKRISQSNFIDYQLTQIGINIDFLEDQSEILIGDLFPNYYTNTIIITSEKDNATFINDKKIFLDSISITMKTHIDSLKERLVYSWKERTLLVIDKKIPFHIYESVRKQLLEIDFFNSTKMNHLYRNKNTSTNNYTYPYSEHFIKHSISKHRLLYSETEWTEEVNKQPWTQEETPDPILNKINISISEDNQILINNKITEDDCTTKILHSKYLADTNNSIFIISPSPKSTYGKYLFIRNRIKDCIDTSKKEYMIEHFGRSSEDDLFSIEKWERDSLNKLFPLHEELGDF